MTKERKKSESSENDLRHVAIILDGNGRWAQARGLSRSEGHREGARNLDRLLDYLLKLKIPNVSLYAFSTENWKRPKEEINSIWKLLNEFFKARIRTCTEKGIRLRVSGDITRLPKLSQSVIRKAEEQTKDGTQLTVNFCINYGSRSEILKAAGSIAKKRIEAFREGNESAATAPVTEEEFASFLYTYPLPDVDLLIRPGGESRISNFLLWQSAYAEIYVTPVLWPDFSEKELDKALAWYRKRERRFGGLNSSA